MGVEGVRCAVTGGSGFVGQRLVEMLCERGATRVVSFDIAPKPEGAAEDPRIEYIQGDISNADIVKTAFKNVDCVWHIAAVVGPFHPLNLYEKVNYKGTLNVIEACRELKIGKIVMSSSPSTRFDGSDMYGVREEDCKIREKGQFLEPYAETKAMGEIAMREACCDALMTVAIAPHQVYGPRDCLFLPNILHASYNGKLRIFADGNNVVSFTHVDNYCHGLILGYDALYKGSPALGNYYVVTDGEPVVFWDAIDQACVAMGYTSLHSKFHLPFALLFVIAHICDFFTTLFGLQRTNLNPFTLKMLTIHRYFMIDNAKRDLGYRPLMTFSEGWSSTLQWFAEHKKWWQAKATGKKGVPMEKPVSDLGSKGSK
eukprot:CFRG7654T1